MDKKWFSKLRPLNGPDIFMDDAGRFLPDFSYAGAGAIAIGSGHIRLSKDDLDVTGSADCRETIQRALDNLEKSGGGTLELPPGVLRIDIPENQDYGIQIRGSGIELLGATDGQTLLWTPTRRLRKKCLLQIGEADDGFDNENDACSPSFPLNQDILPPTDEIAVSDTAAFSVGDWIILRTDFNHLTI